MKIVVITGKSESGDDYGPWLFTSQPNEKQLKNFLRQVAEGEFVDGVETEDDDEAGPGVYGSYLHIEIHECNIDDPTHYG